MGRSVGIKVGGDMVTLDDGKARLVLAKLRTAVSDLRPYWDRFIHPAFLEAERAWFESAGQGSWPANDPDYAAWKSSHGGKGVLRLTDMLFTSLTSEGGEHVYSPTSNRAVMGTQVPTGNLHLKNRPAVDVASSVMQEHLREALMGISRDLGMKWAGGT